MTDTRSLLPSPPDFLRRQPGAAPRPYRIADVQDDIEVELSRSGNPSSRGPEEYAQPQRRFPEPPIPAYVEHIPDVSEIGRMTATAVIQEWETASKAIEAMGSELSAAARRLEEALADVADVMKGLEETAQAHRDRGKQIFLQIEAQSQLTAHVRTACAAMREKLAAS